MNSGNAQVKDPDFLPSLDDERTITVAIGSFSPGFNPHLIADANELTSAVANLVLPSPFITEPELPNLQINYDLVSSVSADTDANGAATAIHYELANSAQWSDGTPISGADFQYLYEQMTTQPGVIDPFLYESIEDLTVSGGGTKIDVTLKRPLAEWRQLFMHLLPSHLYRSSGDFAELMTNSVAASGNRFAVKTVDPARGVIVLMRNDRYWGEHTAQIENIVLRTESDSTVVADMLRSGQVEAAIMQPKATTKLTLETVPNAVVRTRDYPRQLNAIANTASQRMNDPAIRRAILGGIDATTIAKVLSQRAEATAPAGTLPAELGGSEQERVRQLFTADNPLRITVDQGNYTAVSGARIIADQLQQRGIPTRVYPLPFEKILTNVLSTGSVDLLVAWQPIQQDSNALASSYSCTAGDRPTADPKVAYALLNRSQKAQRPRPEGKRKGMDDDGPGGKNQDSVQSTLMNSTPSNGATSSEVLPSANASDTSAESSASAAPATPGAPSDSMTSAELPGAEVPGAEPLAVSANLSSYCTPELDAELSAAAAGQMTYAQLKSHIDSINLEQGLVQPLLQSMEVYAVMPTLLGPRVAGAMPVTVNSGIFSTADRWHRENRIPPSPQSTVTGSDAGLGVGLETNPDQGRKSATISEPSPDSRSEPGTEPNEQRSKEDD